MFGKLDASLLKPTLASRKSRGKLSYNVTVFIANIIELYIELLRMVCKYCISNLCVHVCLAMFVECTYSAICLLKHRFITTQ